jgi:hypothetical protein
VQGANIIYIIGQFRFCKCEAIGKSKLLIMNINKFRQKNL